MSATLNAMMAQMLPRVEQEMKEVLFAAPERQEAPFYQMMHYHMGWLDGDLSPVEGNGGKRIRPILALLCASAMGAPWTSALPAAAAIELLHNFTLVHDDIQDASLTRRGRPTVWKRWGVPQAINCGDCMFALAHTALYRLEERGVAPHVIVRAAQRFDDTCFELTLGQHRDMNFEAQEGVSAAEYMEMIGGKTAALLALCGELGSLVGGAADETIRHYREFCRNLGLAFQIKDDILGIWGDEAEIGKSASTDIVTKKKTLPVLYGLARHDHLQALYANERQDAGFVETVVEILEEVGAYDFSQQEAARYSQRALDHLEAAAPQGEAGQALHELAGQLLARSY